MKQLLLEPCFIFIILLVISVTNTPTCLCVDDASYTNCSDAFSCGNNNFNLKYPFWGENRGNHCGGGPNLESEKLTCEAQVPKITINLIKYRVLGWENTSQILKVARDDYWDNNNICVNGDRNSTFDNTPFQYDYDGLLNVTLFYDCPASFSPSTIPSLPPSTVFSFPCGGGSFVYYTAQALPSSYEAPCKIVVIPIFQTNNDSLDNSERIIEALQGGFEIEWTGNYEKCEKCTGSGGECGSVDGNFQCFCKDGPHPASCKVLMHFKTHVNLNCNLNLPLPFIYYGVKSSVSLLYQAILLRMQLLLQGIFFSFLVMTIILNQILTSCAADDVHYLKCGSPFHCANLKNLSYPFWGFSRPLYCGHPAFKLQCTGEVATVTIMSENYRVLEVNDSDHRIKLVRTDYWNNTCPTSLRNFTIGCTFFDYGSDSRNLTLYYDCSSPSFLQPDSFPPKFNCSVNGTQMNNYFVDESMLANAETSVSISEILGACKSRVVVPILESEAEVLETNSTVENLKAALENGFGVEWEANNSLCDECQNSGGHCGYDPISSEFACHCRGGSFPSTCKSENQTMLSLSTIITATILIFYLHHTTSLPPHATLSSCHVTSFNCGSITNLSYPFTGGDRPSFCGPPQFHLNCRNGVVAELNISSVSYRVIDIDSEDHTLTLARLDLWNETCTDVYVNSTFDGPVFSYGSGNQNLTLFYECKPTSRIIETPENLFNCWSNGDKNNSYSLVGPFPLDPILEVVECDEHVKVPILKVQADRLVENRSLLGEVLMKGFNVNYMNPYESECFECLDSGGVCGFDSDNDEHICICGDHLCATPGSSKVGVAIGASIGAVVALVVILGCVYFVMQRRRKTAYNKQRSMELFIAPSSGDTFASTTNTSQSLSSYQSSNTDPMPPRSYYFGVQVFTYEELEEATKNFDSSRELGEGGFGTVYKGQLKDGRVVAVKRHYESNSRRIEQFMNEVQILARLRHKSLVTLFGCTSRHSRELLLVYEFIPNGTVADHLQGRSSNSTNLLPWPVRLNIAVETAEALAYLHANDVIHRDVKTNNILLDDNFRVKVADFGLSRDFPNHVTHVSTAPQGTPGYVDPEYYQCYQLTDKSDVYSFGVVLVELISSLQAVDINRNRSDVNLANMAINKIQNQELHELVDPYLGFERDYAIRRMTTGVAELAFRCLQQEREIRPSMNEVVEILRGIKSDDGLGAREETEVLEVRIDEARLLKKVSPVSPDSVVDKCFSGSSVSNSS
ncbi:hypothetical protein JHK82_051942 [Glycine max]|nr:hypothetical protein JHK82_051942 [Glycine max]